MKQINTILLRFIILILTSCGGIDKSSLCSTYPSPALHESNGSSLPSSLRGALKLEGYLSFDNIEHAAKDFGNTHHFLPSAVLYPKSASDISSLIQYISGTELTVAARGRGHSLQGQSQANNGVVVHMESLRAPRMCFQTVGDSPYVDASAGELWINLLHESLKHGLSPKSWTDYLHLSIGGTLSNAGISGQAFRHGPQINNVYQLEVVTGRGEKMTCSEEQNTDLFNATLGGLGQFGVITRARIALEPAPKMVKWARVLYSDFAKFCKDQEALISSKDPFDYVEGFVVINRTGLVNNWRSIFNPKDPVQASKFSSEGKTLFCLEVAKYFNQEEGGFIRKKIDTLLSKLNYIPSTLFLTEVPYKDFLDRVHTSEMKLREKGLWEVPHPWLNLMIPKTKIHAFAKEVFGNIVTDTSNGPILIYPIDKSKWRKGTSLVTPEENVFYLVAFLSSAIPLSTGKDGLQHIISQNRRILDFCRRDKIGMKQYLPHYSTTEEWKAHFGSQWEAFVRRKSLYDPLAILAPGHRIFRRVTLQQQS
ncbi:unnamed protein product [Cuscuta campestris]|uniref:cytokinin dehydrogenase n=1 Tax=Cuscuta campestris TaxID=132261 RepID=A0A484LPU1_9ASTE|nr:unnamed protein product [Cuscuta campestris]